MAYFHTTVLDNQIKALPTVDTASGSIATFDTDMTENLVEVKCQIVATQSGSGTPSPDNVRPITTFSEMNVVQMSDITNKTFFDGLLLGTHNFYKFTGSESWTFNSANQFFYTTLSLNSANYVKNSSYPIENDGITSFLINPNIIRVYLDANPSITSDTDMNTVFTSDSYMIYELATPKTPTITKAQFETLLTAFGIDGSLYNIPFGQTVANGVLDVTTGKLRVTHGVKDLGTLSWTKNADWGGAPMFVNSSPINDAKGASSLSVKADAICDIYDTQTRDYIYNNTNVNAFNLTDLGYMQVRTTLSYATENDFQIAMSGHYLVYELKTPIEIQLDSITLQTLLNENNIWCDTGDTSVKYILSVGKKIS